MSRNKEKTARTLKKQLAKVIKTIDKYLLILMRSKGSARKLVGSTHEQDTKNMLREHRAISEVVETFSASLLVAEEMRDIPIEKSFFTGDSSSEMILKECWNWLKK